MPKSQPRPKGDVLQQALQQQSAQPTLYGGYPMDVLSQAFSMQESSGGKNMGPRYEKNFQRLYGKKYETELYPELFAKMLAKYGPEKVYASYGARQVMWPVAVELGFRGEPPELADDAINRAYFEKKFLRDWRATKGDFDTTVMRYNGNNPDYVRQLRRYLPPLEQQ